jgi:hypothetical protein
MVFGWTYQSNSPAARPFHVHTLNPQHRVSQPSSAGCMDPEEDVEMRLSGNPVILVTLSNKSSQVVHHINF